MYKPNCVDRSFILRYDYDGRPSPMKTISILATFILLLLQTMEAPAKHHTKKEFTDVTDWTYINLEPGDIIQHSTPTLVTGTLARVIENTVDSRFFCRIIAKEI